ncbi:TMEM143 family protein [Nocardia halotolerans]|uniref:TMEM143 family protein n=1 Tax=Nocardia halotolerans TaxID=1755878 RepID=A0ABV8VLT0_9NOCA
MDTEHYIPFRKNAVIGMCAEELAPAERTSFEEFARILAAVLHHRFHRRIEILLDAYHQVDPADDVQVVNTVTEEQRTAARQRLETELVALAEAANYTRVSDEELNRAFEDHALVKVRMEVDTEGLDRVLIFRRGESERTHEVKSLFGLRRKTVEFTNYAKVLVFVAFTAGVPPGDKQYTPGSVMVKLFRNVPRADLEMLYPNVRVRMRSLDKLLIGVPAVISGVVVIATKLLTSLGLLLLLVGFWVGLRDDPVELDQTTLISMGAGFAAFGGYLMRQVNKFKNRKIQFMKALSEHLYFRTLANDASVFHHLLGAAEESEVKEAVLAYYFLHTAEHPLTVPELDQQVEEWFARRWDTEVEFDVDDGVRKLRTLDLITDAGDGRIAAVPLPEAKQRLDHLWDHVFDYNDELDVTADRAGDSGQRSAL